VQPSIFVPFPCAGHSERSNIKVYGNEAQGLNDCVKGNPGRLNAVAIHVTYRGWPYVFMMTDEDVQAGGELFISYGERFWDKEDLLAGMFDGTDEMKMIPVSR
jgi:hypothetical protein